MPNGPGLPPLTDQFSHTYRNAAREGTLLIQLFRASICPT